MLRFVDLGDQISDDQRQFAWYDTVTDKFLEWSGQSVFDGWDEFVAASNLSNAHLYRYKNCFGWEFGDNES